MAWGIFWDKNDLLSLIHQKLQDSHTIQEIVVAVQREIHIPHVDPAGDMRDAIREMYQKLMQDLRQELYEEISQSQVKFVNEWNNHLRRIEESLTKTAKTTAPAPPPNPLPVQDLTLLKDEIGRMGQEQQVIAYRLSQLEGRINTPPAPIVSAAENNAVVENRLATQSREIEILKKASQQQAQDLARLQKALAAQIKESIALKQQLIRNEEGGADLSRQGEGPAPKVSALQRQRETNAFEAVAIKMPEDTAVKATSAKPQVVATTARWIDAFALPKADRPRPFFHGNSVAVKENLADSIQKMDNLITHVQQSSISDPAKSSFEKNLVACMNALEKLYHNFKFDDTDEDELSECVTDKFFHTISEHLLDNVMVGIYRGGQDAVGYKEFLRQMNRYLSHHGIYTLPLVPGTVAEGEIISHIDPPVIKETLTAADDGKIDEVELLPYFMSYEDDNANIDTVRKRGRIVRLKYGG